MQLGSGISGIYLAVSLILSFCFPTSSFILTSRSSCSVSNPQQTIRSHTFCITNTTSLSTYYVTMICVLLFPDLQCQDGDSYINIYILVVLYDGGCMVWEGRKGELVQNTQ